MQKSLVICLALAMLLTAGSALAEPSQGEKLVRDLWATSAAKQWTQKAGMISPAFQSVQPSGVHDKVQELTLLDKAEFSHFVLTGFRTTQQGPVMVVTYLAKVEEIKDGLRVSSKTTPRMSVFLKTEKGWQWLAHASVCAP